jgi:hypothetical protein
MARARPGRHNTPEDLQVVKIHTGLFQAVRGGAFLSCQKKGRSVQQPRIEEIFLIRRVLLRFPEHIQPLGHKRACGALDQDKIQLFSLVKPREDPRNIPLRFRGGM